VIRITVLACFETLRFVCFDSFSEAISLSRRPNCRA
jgi:hypothetical protein